MSMQSYLLSLLVFLIGAANSDLVLATNLSGADTLDNAWPTDGIAIAIPTMDFSRSIDVPPKVVQAAKKVLEGDPDTWRARDARNYMIYNVIWLFDKDNHFMSFLPQTERWVRLNDMKSMSYISHLFHLTENDFEKYRSFPIKELSCIYQGYDAIELTKYYCLCQDKKIISDADRREQQRRYAGQTFHAFIPTTEWEFEQGANPKKIAILRSLCGEVARTKRATFEYTSNCLTSHGSVDHWDVTGGIDENKNLIISSISVKELIPSGTFEYPIRGGFW